MLGILEKYIHLLAGSVLKPVEEWVMSRSWGVRIVILFGLLLVAGASWKPEYAVETMRYASYVERAAGHVSPVPLSPDLTQKLRQTNVRLQKTVENDFYLFSNPNMTPWSISQAAFALPPDRQTQLNAADYAAYLHRNREGQCFCWPEEPDKRSAGVAPHIAGWILAASAALGVETPPEDIASLLDEQDDHGWWPTFVEAHDAQFASTYATAWAVMGLISQRDHHMIKPEQLPRVNRAISRASSWLLTTRKADGRWFNYPASDRGTASASISGLVLHVLHLAAPDQVGDIDRQWLRNLPKFDPNMAFEAYYFEIPTATGAYFDHFAQVTVPWTLIATVDAYPNGTTFDRAVALAWIERTVDNEAVLTADTNEQNCWRAELLYGLRYLEDHADTLEGRTVAHR